MFCPNCGANTPDGSLICESCGASIENAVYPPVPVSKKEFFASVAGPKTKSINKLAPIISAIAILLILVCVFTVLNGSLLNVPLISMALDDNANKNEIKEDMQKSYDQLEDAYEKTEDDMSSSEKKAVEKLLKSLKKLTKNFSISNIQGFIKACDQALDDIDDLEEFSEIENVKKDMDSVSEVCSIASTVVWIAFIPALLLAMFANLTKSKGLTIASMIVTVIPQLLLCGFLLVVLSAIVNILHIILCSKLTSAYRQYTLTGITE